MSSTDLRPGTDPATDPATDNASDVAELAGGLDALETRAVERTPFTHILTGAFCRR
jgi:hypothetical protein